MIQANGTDAKEIAIHFVKLNNIRATSHLMGKSITQAKGLLQAGFTKEEVLEAMEYAVTVKGVVMYSLGYMSASIHDLLREIKQKKEQEETKRLAEEVKEQLASQPMQTSEVRIDNESAQRNREKAERIRNSFQSRLRKKYDFDMFEGE